MILCESYAKAIPLESARWKMARPVGDYLRGKFDSGEPAAMFAAVRTWEDYLDCFHMDHGTDILVGRLSMMYKPFTNNAGGQPWVGQEWADVLSAASMDGESSVELWYPVAKRPFETVVATSSFLPVIAYYMHKIDEWGYVFQECKVCEKTFIARSRHYELCSQKCRKERAYVAKREFDGRAKDSRLEQLDRASYFYWYNRLRKLKKGNDNVKTAAFKAVFDDFRKEAVKRKNMVKCGEMKLEGFADWLIVQEEMADRLLGELDAGIVIDSEVK
jgi:hypothetical protein